MFFLSHSPFCRYHTLRAIGNEGNNRLMNTFHLNPIGGEQLGAGLLNGFINSTPLGQSNDRQALSGLIGSRLGAGTQRLPEALAKPQDDETKRIGEEEDERRLTGQKEDSVDIQDFARQAVDQAMESAAQRRSGGGTNQIFVSEDGRFEASVDLQVRQDGSFDLNLEVSMAEARSASIAEIYAADPSLARLGESGASYASVQQDSLVSFEQVVTGRDFEARLFYEEASHMAVEVGNAYGEQLGGEVRGVAGELANEYTLNISISGESLESFNQQVGALAAREDGDQLLPSFLSAAGNVINNAASGVDGFFAATQSLLDSARAVIGSNLQDFFGGLQEQYGGVAQEFGFGENFFETMGEETGKNLNDFFTVTNDFFGELFGNALTGGADTESLLSGDKSEQDVLQETLETMNEYREEAPPVTPQGEIAGNSLDSVA